MDSTIKDFEAAIAELETIVKKLEEGDLPLEKSLELYERGVQLSRFCHTRLEDAEKRIEILNERGEIKPAGSAFALEGGGRRVELEFESGYPYAQVFAPPDDPVVAFEPMTAPADALVKGGAEALGREDRIA